MLKAQREKLNVRHACIAHGFNHGVVNFCPMVKTMGYANCFFTKAFSIKPSAFGFILTLFLIIDLIKIHAACIVSSFLYQIFVAVDIDVKITIQF